MDKLESLKLGLLFAIFAEGLVGGLLPLAFRRFNRNNEFLLNAHAFAGGVFIAVALVHLLAGAEKSQAKAAPNMKYPLSITVAALGFLGVLLIERVVANGSQDECMSKPQGQSNTNNDEDKAGSSGQCEECNDTEDPQRRPPVSRPNKYTMIEPPERSWINVFMRLTDGIITLAALTVHALLAGVALGISPKKEGTINVFIAVAAHKAVAAFAVGIKLVNGGATIVEMLVLITVFAATTPVGIAVGIATTNVDVWAQLIIKAIAAGAFLYVGASELSGPLFDTNDVDATAEPNWPFLSRAPPSLKRAVASPAARRCLRFFSATLGFGILVIAEYYGKYH